jgi:glycosyltransferase involved in cell wall biosynthesis
MKVLFVPNWEIQHVVKFDEEIPIANQSIQGHNYWFFKYWPIKNLHVDILDIKPNSIFSRIEKKLKIHIFQSIKVLLTMKNYDLIIAHSANSGLGIAILKRILGIKKPPLILIDIGSLNGGNENSLEISILNQIVDGIDWSIYHSSIIGEFYRRHFPKLWKRSSLVYFGVDPEFFKPIDNSRDDYILSIGYAKRDWNLLLESAKRIDYKIIILGVNKNDFSNIPKNIKLINKIPINQLKRYINNAQFIILPITNEKYSVGQTTLLICMSMGKTIISTNVPGIVDYIKNNKTGILLPQNSISTLINTINTMIHHPQLLNTIGDDARKTIITTYNEEQFSRSFFKLINDNIL